MRDIPRDSIPEVVIYCPIMAGTDARAPEDLLPLPTAAFHILVALADHDRHGYAIMQDIAERTGGKIRMSPGTLYGAISRLLEQGLISELRDTGRPAMTTAGDVIASLHLAALSRT